MPSKTLVRSTFIKVDFNSAILILVNTALRLDKSSQLEGQVALIRCLIPISKSCIMLFVMCVYRVIHFGFLS